MPKNYAIMTWGNPPTIVIRDRESRMHGKVTSNGSCHDAGLIRSANPVTLRWVTLSDLVTGDFLRHHSADRPRRRSLLRSALISGLNPQTKVHRWLYEFFLSLSVFLFRSPFDPLWQSLDRTALKTSHHPDIRTFRLDVRVRVRVRWQDGRMMFLVLTDWPLWGTFLVYSLLEIGVTNKPLIKGECTDWL